MTNAPGNAAKFRQRVAQDKTHHGVVWVARLEMRGQQLEGLRAVKIIGVDDPKRFLDGRRRHQNCVPRSPRFPAIGRHDFTRRQAIQFLKDILHGHALLETVADGFAKCRLHVPANHEYQLIKSRTNCVMHRVINNGLPAKPDRVGLFEPAVTAAHARC